MRNGKALLSKLMQTVACTICLFAWCSAPVLAEELEETDSGAPSASVMFAVTGNATAALGTMQPVVFNHLIHERAIDDCETCHHTGDPQTCSDCHTVTGSEEGGGITLERAMHATKIAPRADGTTPTSCVSCHEDYIKSKQECMGCHSVVTPRYDAAWCGVCHSANATPEQVAKGTAGSLMAEENLEIATELVLNRKEPTAVPDYFPPTKVRIDALADEYQPVLFSHRDHVVSVNNRVKDNILAKTFHYQTEVICSTCHHRSPLSMTPPKCSSCHQAKIDPENPGRPNLKAAYHLQCMGCHEGMNVARPAKTDCTTCHKPAEE